MGTGLEPVTYGLTASMLAASCPPTGVKRSGARPEAVVIPSILSSIPSPPPDASSRYRHCVARHSNFALQSPSRTIEE
jgi:hypothetical protein